jgi:hypothetical protein
MWAFFAVVLVVLLAVGIGIPAYNMGVAQGLADSGKIVVPPAGAPPAAVPPVGVPYGYGWRGHFGPFGFGFGFLWCLFPLLFFFLFFGVMRAVFWKSGFGWRGSNGTGVPPRFEEWHKRAHGEPPPAA